MVSKNEQKNIAHATVGDKLINHSLDSNRFNE